jgi:hypothetical protein
MEEFPNSFRVVSSHGGFDIFPVKYDYMNPLSVNLKNTGIWESNGTRDRDHFFTLGYDCYSLMDNIAEHFVNQWHSPKNKPIPSKRFSLWLKKKMSKSVTLLAHPEWQRCLNELDPKITALQKRLFAIAGGKGTPYHVDRTLSLSDNYLIGDIMKYRAAGLAVLFIDSAIIKRYGWMAMFASDYNPYRSLRRTLMSLPNGIGMRDLCFLPDITLPEPVTTKLKLMAYLSLAHMNNNDQTPFIRMLQRSTEQDVKKAIQLMWHYFPDEKTGDFRRTSEIRRALRLIYDCPIDPGNVDILGFAKRSEEYHHNDYLRMQIEREAREREMALHKAKEKAMMKSKTAIPPIPLPDNPAIKFLDTYQAVVDEGASMNHCIATYARKAVVGGCYLFHVDYNGIPASVEVSPRGYVEQSYGERDKINEASEYGKRMLSTWAKGLLKCNGKPIIDQKIKNIEEDGAVAIPENFDLPF